jgi:ABC-type molybdenum transport system ATPase subunit/photorepair protein PhrA
MSQPGIKKKVSLSSPSLHHKFKERLAGKPVIQGDESGAGVSFGFV